jgi:TatD DNase family protein
MYLPVVMIVDSHAHLDDLRFDSDRNGVLQRARQAGVQTILTIGNGGGPDDMGCGIPFAEQHDWIYTSVGVHPHDAKKVEEHHYALMRELASHPKVVAIGETGLDYHYDHSPRPIQREVFERQAALALDVNLPVIVHTRDADADTEEILKRSGSSRGVVHCFTSGARLAEFALSIGFYISFSGIVTFPNAGDLAAIARDIPADRLLVETDCPYLAPVPHRGKRNEPAFAADTAKFIAALRGIALDELAAQTTANFHRVFGVKTA